MTVQPNALGELRPDGSPRQAEQKLRNWPRLARRAWIVLALLLLVYFLAGIPALYQSLQTGCTPASPPPCSEQEVAPGRVQALTPLHLSVATYTGLMVGLTLAVSSLFYVIGVVIFWRTPREWRGLFYSLLLVFFGAALGAASVLPQSSATTQTPLLLQLLVSVNNFTTILSWAALAAFILTFPTGRLIPRWSGVLILFIVAESILPDSTNPAVYAAQNIAQPLTYCAMTAVQVYRYARVYDAVQRQQTKWFLFAGAVSVSLLLIYRVPANVVPGLSAADSWYQLLGWPIGVLTLVNVPLSVGIAILRYRLWDVDVLINRALVYASLTALLAGLYFGLILALQALVRALTGSLTQQPLVLVASTLAIAALFQPLRWRLQTTIDGRFYRRKYDAAQVVAAFSSTLRQEVDLDDLREQLVAVVQETMQPTHVSVWLRPASQAKKPPLQSVRSSTS